MDYDVIVACEHSRLTTFARGLATVVVLRNCCRVDDPPGTMPAGPGDRASSGLTQKPRNTGAHRDRDFIRLKGKHSMDPAKQTGCWEPTILVVIASRILYRHMAPRRRIMRKLREKVSVPHYRDRVALNGTAR